MHQRSYRHAGCRNKEHEIMGGGKKAHLSSDEGPDPVVVLILADDLETLRHWASRDGIPTLRIG